MRYKVVLKVWRPMGIETETYFFYDIVEASEKAQELFHSNHGAAHHEIETTDQDGNVFNWGAYLPPYNSKGS